MNTMTDPTYHEELSSRRTEALFLALTLIFLALFVWRSGTSGLGGWSIAFLVLFLLFLFYSINYRTLVLRITGESVKLRFGVFTWTVQLDNIEDCYVDTVPMVRIGGAGIHFTSIQRRYRVMFNFIEYPRLVIALKKKMGWVRDVVFSTRHPAEIENYIREAISRQAK